MSKRRITHQQQQRIMTQQNAYQHTKEDVATKGLVISRYGKHATVLDEEKNQSIHCSIRPNLSSIVTGDRILFQRINDTQGVIISLYPRTTLLARYNERGQEKPIAANITQINIVVAKEPELSWLLLDSYLLVAEKMQIKALIVLNKVDLDASWLQNALNRYAEINYPLICTGFNQPQQDEALLHQLSTEVSVFVGQSGVGKSSLIQRLLPHETLQTGELSDKSKQGQHTTSCTTLYHLPQGGMLIDSPGVRAFTPEQIDLQGLAHYFVEFRPFIPGCKFRNCDHIHNPHCKVIEAVAQQQIFKQRYENYVKIHEHLSKKL